MRQLPGGQVRDRVRSRHEFDATPPRTAGSWDDLAPVPARNGRGYRSRHRSRSWPRPARRRAPSIRIALRWHVGKSVSVGTGDAMLGAFDDAVAEELDGLAQVGRRLIGSFASLVAPHHHRALVPAIVAKDTRRIESRTHASRLRRPRHRHQRQNTQPANRDAATSPSVPQWDHDHAEFPLMPDSIVAVQAEDTPANCAGNLPGAHLPTGAAIAG